MTGANAVTWSKTQSRARSDVTALALRRRSAEVGSTPLVTPLKAEAAAARESTATQRILGTKSVAVPRNGRRQCRKFTAMDLGGTVTSITLIASI